MSHLCVSVRCFKVKMRQNVSTFWATDYSGMSYLYCIDQSTI